MVPLRNPQVVSLRGYLFAYLPILSAWVMACDGTLPDDFSAYLSATISPSDSFKPE